MTRFVKPIINIVIVIVIFLMLAVIWNRYMYTPWTRDGRVRAQVVSIAPDVSGWVDTMNAPNAANVKAGDVLFTIDRARYRVAQQLAAAQVSSAQATWRQSANVYGRRRLLTAGEISMEELDSARLDTGQKLAAIKQAQANADAASLNLNRTVYRSPADGQIINLDLERGDYVAQGVERLALLRNDSYYVTGYFEETKIPRIAIGDPVDVWVMAGYVKLTGHVASIDSGISNGNATPGNERLPSVEPNFAWIRLSQRIPVNVRLDTVPKTVHLSAGMSATLKVHPTDKTAKEHPTAWSAIGAQLSSVLP